RVREANAILQAVVADGACRLGHLARRIAFVAARVARGAIELILELRELLADLVAALDHLPRGLLPAGAARHLLPHLGCLALLTRDLIGLLQRVFDVALRTLRLRPLQLPLRALDAFERLLRPGLRAGIARGG